MNSQNRTLVVLLLIYICFSCKDGKNAKNNNLKDSIDDFNNLKILHQEILKERKTIDNNEIKYDVHYTIDKSNIKYLELNNTPLGHLPNSINNFNSLSHLALWNMDLKELPALNSLKLLKILELKGNNFNSIPHLDYLINLKTLDLTKNKLKDTITITSLPTSLSFLSLSNNKISHIRFQKPLSYKNLRMLSIYSNNIKSLDESIYNLPNLRNLYLKDNPILKVDLKRLDSIEYIEIDKTSIDKSFILEAKKRGIIIVAE